MIAPGDTDPTICIAITKNAEERDALMALLLNRMIHSAQWKRLLLGEYGIYVERAQYYIAKDALPLPD